MRRLLAFIGGALTGGTIGTAVALFFTPASGSTMRGGLRARYQRAVEAGQAAAAQKRAELETQLIEMTGPHPVDSPMAPKQSGNGRQ
jgi:gas vesicle protein